MTDADGIRALFLEANATPACVGLIAWMHTFSPAKMWIGGLDGAAASRSSTCTRSSTARSRGTTIDMDFMNLNQAAHGDREFGFIAARMRLERKVVVGHWSDDRGPGARRGLDAGGRARSATGRPAGSPGSATTCATSRSPRATRSRPQRRLGFRVNTYGVGDLVAVIAERSDAEVDDLIATYLDEYDVDPVLRPGAERAESLRDGARIEIGLRRFLDDGGFIGVHRRPSRTSTA